MNDRRVVLLQLAIADYRESFMRMLVLSRPGIDIQVGDHYFEPTTRTSAAIMALPGVRHVRNHYFLGKLAWQSIDWRTVGRADVVIVELNPRILSNWCVLILRRALGKRTLLWGHAWPRAGANSWTERLRRMMRQLGTGLILYTESQKSELQQRYGGGESMFVAPNALYKADDMSPATGEARDFIYVGRLIQSKKVGLLIRAFEGFVKAEADSTLHLVGTGEELDSLKRTVEARGIPNVIFHGHIADLGRLRELYSRSVASISPGYVGLSITQSFSFGVPMIIARDEAHSPEIECAVEGLNCSFFESDSPCSLEHQMRQWYYKRAEHPGLAKRIVADCRARYSTERMVGGFLDAIGA